MPRYRTLVIAPRVAGLPYADQEIMAVVNLLGAQVLQGEGVTLERVIERLQEQWDIVWFITHGDEQGIALSNQHATAAQLTQGIRASEAKLVVLNTCSSSKVAFKLHSELGTYLICTIREIPDQAAYITGRLLAASLGDGASFPAAYNAAIPGQNEDYLYLPGREERIVMPPTPRRVYGTGREEETLEQLQRIVEQLDAIVNGSTRYHLVGLVESNRIVTAKVDEMSTRIAKMEGSVTTLRRAVVALFVICVCLILIIFLIYFFQERGGVV